MNLVARENLENALPLFEKLKAISAKCADSSCLKLRLGFLDKMLLEWHTALKAPFEKQVESELSKAGFPFKNGSTQFVISKPLSDALITLEQLDLPNHLRDASGKYRFLCDLITYRLILLPLHSSIK